MVKQWGLVYRKDSKDYKYYDLDKPHQDLFWITSLFKNEGVKKILDLGCGSGRNFFYLEKKGFDVYGVDSAPEGLKVMKKKGVVASKLKVGDVFSKLPYLDGFFDAVVSVQVLQHSREKGILKAISEIRRVLKPGGILFVTVAGRYSLGKLRYCLVKTAKKVSNNTYVPTLGEEKGLIHFIYNKDLLLKHYSSFFPLELWKDGGDYYCYLGLKDF